MFFRLGKFCKKMRSSYFPRLMGTCTIPYQEKREGDEKNILKLNTFVSILRPYSRPPSALFKRKKKHSSSALFKSEKKHSPMRIFQAEKKHSSDQSLQVHLFFRPFLSLISVSFVEKINPWCLQVNLFFCFSWLLLSPLSEESILLSG